jgi:predicted porin
MRIPTLLTIAALPVIASAQQSQAPQKHDPSKAPVEVTGCVRGSTLTETNLRVGGANDENPTRRWRLRGSKTLMNQIKQQAGREIQIVGTTKSFESMATAARRIGKTNIYIGGDANRTARDPLPDLPTIDVERFEPTGEQCR